MNMMFGSIKFITWIRALERLAPGMSTFLIGLIPERIVREKRESFDLATQKLVRRTERRPEYTDFMTHLIMAEEKGQITMEDMKANAPVFVLAGSETTSTVLSGATYYMLKDPRVYALVVDEVRSNFNAESEITIAKVSELTYLLAMLDETLRLYPPGANNHPRLTPAQGAVVAGEFIPANCMIGINQYAMFRYPGNFANPDAFVPERVLQADPMWKGDKRDALQPFSYGPRNCIGRK
jgi:cytochrome P450